VCGITGYAGFHGEALLPGMVDALRHRGPDDSGIEEYGPAGLGFARLSIVDLAGGHQPLTGETGQVHAVVNGEIYNHERLRAELSALGHAFATHSDSESVLHAYEQWGTDAFARLEGMFGAAVWDERTGTLVLARDRLGKKPVYWAQMDGGVLFASELKSLLDAGVSRDISPLATLSYLSSDSVPTPDSIFTAIHKLPAGGFLRWSADSGVEVSTFWPDVLAPAPSTDVAGWTATLEDHLRSAVRDRLMADVPLGLYLSAGVDSMLVSALARDLAGEPLHSFTLRFESDSYDESTEARAFAEGHGFIHHEVPAGTADMVAAVDRFVDVFDEPLNDPATLVMLPLAQASAAHIKVALTGDGGDELFYGYRHLRMHELFERIPDPALSALRPLRRPLAAVPDSGGYFSAGFKAQRLSRGLAYGDLVERDLAWRGAFTLDAASSLLAPGFRAQAAPSQVVRHFRGIVDDAPVSGGDLDRWSWLYLRSYLLDTVLVKVDRATMAYGVEARSPLLDHELVELVLRMPLALKTGEYRNKRLLRSILARTAPQARPATTKHGMGVPVRDLLLGPLHPRLRDLSGADYLARQGIFEPAAVARLVADLEGGRRDVRKEAWGFLVFQMWFERWAGAA
jgi:asparagine synthase (glutamine-hydrolysing)